MITHSPTSQGRLLLRAHHYQLHAPIQTLGKLAWRGIGHGPHRRRDHLAKGGQRPRTEPIGLWANNPHPMPLCLPPFSLR